MMETWAPPPPPPSRRTWIPIAVALGVVAVAVAILAVVLVARDGGSPSADELIGRASRFAGDARTVRYDGEIKVDVADPAAGGTVGTTITVEESAELPDRSSSRQETADGFVSESIVVGDVVYERSGSSPAEVEDARWGRYEADVDSDAAPVGPTALDIPGLLADADDATLRGRSGDLAVVRVDLPAEAFGDGTGESFDEITAELEIDADGRVVSMTLDATGDAGELEAELVDFQWDVAVDIEEPTDDELDPTPTIIEEALAEWDDAPLLAPAAIPTGWELGYADVAPGDVTTSGCDEANVGYVDPDDPVAGYLDVYQFPLECAAVAPPDSRPFTAGPSTGWIVEEGGERLGELVAGTTIVQFLTDLGATELAAVLGNLVPLDLATPPAATVPRGEPA